MSLRYKIPRSLLLKLYQTKTDKVFVTMYPQHSPKFLSIQSVIDWYRTSPDWVKDKFRKSGAIVIYRHKIALKRQFSEGGYEYEVGESTDCEEVAVYDFKTKSWL